MARPARRATMPVESAADRAVFVNNDEFGTTITWNGATLAALFDNPTIMIGTADGPDIQTREVSLIVVEADLPPAAAADDPVTINGTAYLARSIAPDGTGMALVRLERDDG